MVPEPVINAQVGLRPLFGSACPTSIRVKFPKKRLVVALVVP